MRSLNTIADLQADERELLEAAGFGDAGHLAAADAAILVRELEQANRMLRIIDQTPDLDQVTHWIDLANGRPGKVAIPAKKTARKAARKAAKVPAKKAARKTARKAAGTQGDSEAVSEKTAETIAEMPVQVEDAPPPEPATTGTTPAPTQDDPGPAEPGVSSTLVNFEADPDVLDMILRAPVALPMPARILAEKGIAPSAIAVAPLLNRAEGDIDVRVTANSGQKRPRSTASTPRGKPGGLVNVADFRQANRRGIDMTRVRQIDQPPTVEIPEAPPVKVDERLKLLRTAREETNRGKSPGTRRYVRGVLHDRWLLVACGSIIALLLALMIPCAVGSALLLLLSDMKPDIFGWVPKWLLVFPGVLPVIGALYLTVSTRVKCRVCGQKVLVPRHCLKHVKAHYVPLLGHIVPLALHVLLFRWFHCTFCGTAIRTKE